MDRFAACVGSLLAQTYRDFRILLWDNAPASSGALPLDGDDRIRCHRSACNIGFARACNRAARMLADEGCGRLLFVNSDTVADPRMLELLLAGMDRTGAVLVQPTVLMYDGTRVNTDGNSLQFLGFSFCGGYRRPYEPPGTDEPVAVISGSCFLVDTSVFNGLGGFPDDYFMYHEDTDLSWRARLAGYRLYRIGAAVIRHEYDFSLAGKKTFYLERNRLRTVLKNYSLRTLLLLAPIALFLELQLCVYGAAAGWGHRKLAAYLSLVMGLRGVIAGRARVRALRTVPDRELFGAMVAGLDFPEISHPVLVRFTNPVLRAYFRAVRRFIR